MDKLYVFRKYRKKQGKKNVKHAKLIVDSTNNEFGFMGLTTSPYKGKHHKNLKLKQNPQIGNKRQSYLRRKIEYDQKEMFEEILKNYNLSKEDINFIKTYVEKHKRKEIR